MGRTPVPYSVQAHVFFRDHWLCSHCRRPTIFHLALKQLSDVVRGEFPHLVLAHWNPQWRRDAAPLLDELAASIDHVQAFSKGGAHDISNFATICARCNARKGNRSREEHREVHKPWVVKGKHGEPSNWDGLASVFVFFARRNRGKLTITERGWLAALESQLANPAERQGVRPPTPPPEVKSNS
jgi:5-methylcytosine-specific restriction endonuclease McrA